MPNYIKSCDLKVTQRGGSSSPTVPNTKRLVIIEELYGELYHVGWFSSESGWWMVLSPERVDGEKMPHGEWCALSIGNITGWQDISITHKPTERIRLRKYQR